MRGTIAKRIRKKVYGDNSIHTRAYDVIKNSRTVINTGLRLLYQEVKNNYYKTKTI